MAVSFWTDYPWLGICRLKQRKTIKSELSNISMPLKCYEFVNLFPVSGFSHDFFFLHNLMSVCLFGFKKLILLPDIYRIFFPSNLKVWWGHYVHAIIFPSNFQVSTGTWVRSEFICPGFCLYGSHHLIPVESRIGLLERFACYLCVWAV